MAEGDISVAHVDGPVRAFKITGEDKGLLLDKIDSLASAARRMTPDEFERGAVFQSLIGQGVESMFHSGDQDIKLDVAPGINPNHHRNALRCWL